MLSTRLVHNLVSLGVGPKVAVPFCLEKSKWSPVAMMGVMKAGGSSVALDGNRKFREESLAVADAPCLHLLIVRYGTTRVFNGFMVGVRVQKRKSSDGRPYIE